MFNVTLLFSSQKHNSVIILIYKQSVKHFNRILQFEFNRCGLFILEKGQGQNHSFIQMTFIFQVMCKELMNKLPYCLRFINNAFQPTKQINGKKIAVQMIFMILLSSAINTRNGMSTECIPEQKRKKNHFFSQISMYFDGCSQYVQTIAEVYDMYVRLRCRTMYAN